MFPSALCVLLLFSIFIHSYPIETRNETENENRFYFNFSKKKHFTADEKKEHFDNSSSSNWGTSSRTTRFEHKKNWNCWPKLSMKSFYSEFSVLTSGWVEKAKKKKEKFRVFTRLFDSLVYFDSWNEFHRFDKHNSHRNVQNPFLRFFFSF